MGRYAHVVLHPSRSWTLGSPGFSSLSGGLLAGHTWRAVLAAQEQRAGFSAAASTSQEPLVTSSTSSRFTTPSPESSLPVPPSPRITRRQKDVSPSARRATTQEALAKIEATRGIVSPFLRDTFAREHDYLRISLTEKCNLRCTYCMPEEGAPLSPKEHLLTTDEVVKLASIFVSNGVRKIRLTGGEPTVRKDLPEIVERLSALGLTSLGMTSNGIALSRKLPSLLKAGLTHLNVSLDTLDPFKFELMTRRRGHSTVLKVLEQASELTNAASFESSRLKSLKLNVVIINGVNDEEVPAFVELTKNLPISIRFIEYMPFDGNKWSTSKMVASGQLLSRIRSSSPPGSIEAITPEPSDTARIYKRAGHAGSFGFISSMTDHFCSGCSRLRLGADGSMKVCLFGEPKLSLRDLLRSGASDLEISQHIGQAVKGKKFAHDGRSVQVSQSYPHSSVGYKRAPYHRRPYTHVAPSFLQVSHMLPLAVASRAFSVSSRLCQDGMPDKPRLTHISEETGKPTMVSITSKAPTSRSATATGRVIIPSIAYDMLMDNSKSDKSGGNNNKGTAKGDVLTVAQLAGIMGSKRTSDLIPLCHPINLTNVQVDLSLKYDRVQGRCSVEVKATTECTGATGVEMEALTAVNVACLTVWDMLKAVAGKEMVIQDIKVIKKSGGKSGDWERSL